MKRILPLIVVTIVAIVSFSCSREDIQENFDSLKSCLSFYAYTPSDESDSRTYTNTSGTIFWNAGDEISVFRSSENERWRFAGKSGEVVNEFVKVDDKAVSPTFARSYAVFPYSVSSTWNVDNAFLVELPSVQDYAENSFGPTANTMVAATKDIQDNILRFKNVCGYLQINLYGPRTIKSVRLYGNNGEPIAGRALVSIYNDSAPSTVMQGDATYEIVLDCGKSGVTLSDDSSQAKPFILVVPPVTFSNGFSIEITDIDGNKVTKSTSKSVTIGRSRVKPMSSFRVLTTIDKINGTTINKKNKIIGLITDKDTGLGIPGIPVTDGYTYTETDENGVYQMRGNVLCRNVYYSLPSNYKTAMDENHCPKFYAAGIDMTDVNRNDFVLEKKTNDERDWTFIGIADPQPNSSSQLNRYMSETMSDIVTTLNQYQPTSFNNAYAVTLGDVAYNTPSLYPSLKKSMSDVKLDNGWYIPFYQCAGNHDHTYGNSQYEALTDFVNAFGPVDYSFNIGDAHIVVMDDIVFPSWSGSTGGTVRCGISDTQYNWLVQDLEYVQNKESKILFFCAHAPFIDGVSDDDDYVLKKYYYDEMLSEFSQFHEAHILSGHTHRAINYRHTDYKCQGGLPVYDHNEVPACGWLWNANISIDGTPNGYTIYEISGNEVVNWVRKSTGYPVDYQMHVYNGNQIYQDTNGKKYCWYDASITPTFSKSELQGAFVANIWEGDDANWKVELYIDGEKYGDLAMVPRYTADLCAQAWWKGSYMRTTAQDGQHYWYIAAPGGDPTSVKNWEIRATHTIPSSKGRKNVYTCSTLQTDFTGF